jgi:hypothetical protein
MTEPISGAATIEEKLAEHALDQEVAVEPAKGAPRYRV